MIVQVFEMYSDDCESNDYEEGELIRVGKDASSASYAILDDPDQDREESERCGELTPGGEYVFRDGKLMGRVDDEWVDWEAEELVMSQSWGRSNW